MTEGVFQSVPVESEVFGGRRRRRRQMALTRIARFRQSERKIVLLFLRGTFRRNERESFHFLGSGHLPRQRRRAGAAPVGGTAANWPIISRFFEPFVSNKWTIYDN